MALCSQQGGQHSRRRRRRATAQSKSAEPSSSLHEERLLAQREGPAEKPTNTEEPITSFVRDERQSDKPTSSTPHFKPVNCNLDRFLDSTCPSVRAHRVPKSCQWKYCRKRQQTGNVESLPFFLLGDLWDCFEEWSAYGAGVPITLKGHEIVMQYYVPYLSALQLYTRSTKRQNTDYRDPLGFRPACCGAASTTTIGEDSMNTLVLNRSQCLCGVFCGTAEACCVSETFEHTGESDLHWNFEDEGCCNSSKSFGNGDWLHHLRFEYFESSPPYTRVPVSEKISQLAAGFPELRTLRSVDLLPASWMSIAWYPIYRIPTGSTLQDLEACFLTFHSLSTSLEDGEPLGIVKRSDRPAACAIPSSLSEMQWEFPTIYLEAFGLAHYKLRGSIWTSVGNPERRHAASLYRCAKSWLDQLHVGHPDFDFFRSHNPPSSAS